jgi:Leucine-rich repeat (LRR) protein
LHCNQLTRIDQLASLGNTLISLNLSANNINRIEGLDALRMLRELNLSSNRIKRLEGLSGLHELVALNVSHNLLTEIGPVFDTDSFQVLDFFYFLFFNMNTSPCLCRFVAQNYVVWTFDTIVWVGTTNLRRLIHC